MTATDVGTGVQDARAAGALGDAGDDVASLWSRSGEVAGWDLPAMGLGAGGRPAADVEVLCSVVARVECELARRMHAAAASGSLPLLGEGALLLARGWSATWARRLARAGGFAEQYPALGGVWAAGIITSEHVWALGRHREALTLDEMEAVIEELAPLWGQLSPRAVGVFVERVIRVLHPPPDPEPDEWSAHEARSLSFAVTGDSVIVSGSLPRVEGEVVMAAIDSFAERLRSEADQVPAAARRADALVGLVNAAHTNGSLPTRGGLPVSLNVTMETTAAGDVVWTTGRGHTLTVAEQRFAGCDAEVTPVAVAARACVAALSRTDSVEAGDAAEEVAASVPGAASRGAAAAVGHPVPAASCPPLGPAGRIAALASTLLGSRVPLAMGRTARTASASQRRALAVRDRGCVVPGCAVPADACQTHHVREWAAGGPTDESNLVLLCWAHHRQVDLGMWSIEPVRDHPRHPNPGRGSGNGTPWPANNGSPWVVTRRPRQRWSG